MKKLIFKILVLTLLFTLSATAVAQTYPPEAFVITWEVEAGETITLPTDDGIITLPGNIPAPAYFYEFTIDWGDGSQEEDIIQMFPTLTNPNTLTPPTHTYTAAGTYTVTITEADPGGFPHIFFNNRGEKNKLLTVEQWGDIRWQSMYRAFHGCENLKINATDIPNLEDVTDMGGMFLNCRQIDHIPNINEWDVSNVTNMADLFLGVGRVPFGSSVGSGWNDYIGDWNVSKVTNMSVMFGEADSFNQDLSKWDVSNVTNMFSMFIRNEGFNQDLSSWDVHNVTNMNSMFFDAKAFDQDLGSWNLKSISSIHGGKNIGISLIVQGSGISCTNYSATLTGWANNPDTPSGLVLSNDPVVDEENRNHYGTNPSATDAVNYLMDDLTGLGWRMDNSVASDGACLLFEIGPPIDDATIDENRPYSTELPLVSSGSPVGGISNVTYSLGGADAAVFTLDEGTGMVTMDPQNFEDPLDADMDNSYEVAVLATDENGNYDRKDWTVTIRNVQEFVTFSLNPIADVHIEDGIPYNRPAPELSGETPVGQVTYTLDGTDGALFEIISTTGTVSMEARDFANPEDANADNVYEVAIIATDEDGNNARVDWTVTIDQVNVTNPFFSIDAIMDASVDENTGYTSVTPVLSGTPVGSVTYTLGGMDAGAFTINVNSGVVSMVARDFENPADANMDNVYEVLITATDEDSNVSATSWTVTVLDVPVELPGEGRPNIPTAFTPNGDGVNDTWVIDDLTSDASVVIRNRQGTILYESRNYAAKPWDGRYKGDVLPAGSYLFTIRNETDQFRGTIVILK